MIISASRRTDIPAFASWFMERIRAGFCDTVNPFNPRSGFRSCPATWKPSCSGANPRPLMPC